MVVKTKYNIGDRVWLISDNKVLSQDVTDVFIEVKDEIIINYSLHCDNIKYPERVLFATKKELLESL